MNYVLQFGLETAGHANPTLNAIEVIANGLGVTVFDLFEHLRQHAHAKRR